MSESKTKKALIGSAGALVLCFALLLGTTFAWFTDNASTKVNKIQAGNLDVALEMKAANGNWVSAEGETLNFIDKEGKSIESTLWEPGCTYYLPTLKVKNDGDLALKYKVEFGISDGDKELAEVLDVYLGDKNVGTLKAMLESTDQDGYVYGNLTAGQKADELSISLRMQKTAGDKYQGKSIAGIYVTVLATQNTVESDSIDNQYDKDAEYAYNVSTIEELRSAVACGGAKIVLADNIELTSEDDLVVAAGSGANVAKAILNVRTDATIDLNGKKLTYSGKNAKFGIYVGSGAALTILDSSSDNSGELSTSGSSAWVVQVGNGTADIYGGSFSTQNDCCIYANNGKINIYGGKFECSGDDQLTLNIGDKYRGEGRGIYVHGGAFKNFKPGVENLDEVFLADGCSVSSSTDASGDIWYTVTAA